MYLHYYGRGPQYQMCLAPSLWLVRHWLFELMAKNLL